MKIIRQNPPSDQDGTPNIQVLNRDLMRRIHTRLKRESYIQMRRIQADWQLRRKDLLAAEMIPGSKDIHVYTVHGLDAVAVSVCLAAGLAVTASDIKVGCAVGTELRGHS